MDNEISLGELLLDIKSTISKSFDQSYWIRATIASMSRKSGHMYMELVDSSKSNSASKPKCRATCWKKAATEIENKFLKDTGINLRSSIDVLLHVKVDFSPEYGFNLNIINIDPQYSVGGIERQIKEIRESLIKDGVYQNNLTISKPPFFTRIAVLAPSSAAGLEDFKADVSPFANNKLLCVDYYHAPFQGQDCGNKMVYALRDIYRNHIENKYDCVVIIRGGGAALDLAFLNHFHLANACCKFPVPVFCGIGHATDKTILDEVCHVFDTPSKVSKYIINAITVAIEGAQANIKTINREVSRRISDQRSKLSVCTLNIKNQTERIIVHNVNTTDRLSYIMKSSWQMLSKQSDAFLVVKKEFKQAIESKVKNEKLNFSLTLKDVKTNAKRELSENKKELINTQDNYHMLVTRKVIEGLKNLQTVGTQIKNASTSQASNHKNKLELMVKNAVGFGVDHTIKQGFVLVRDYKGDIVKDGADLEKDKIYNATFRDCEVDFQYKQMTESEEPNND
jgi:exodeoxyribonuclease VII large subunit